MDIYVQSSKFKSQNTEVTIFEHRTQNICLHFPAENKIAVVIS